jgi:hypothetical protein
VSAYFRRVFVRVIAAELFVLALLALLQARYSR